jgi:D-serine deaminase-like pyridoxal phosphate-dependent protein
MTGAPPRDHAYYRRALSGRRLPLAFVDLELFDANVAAVRARAAGKPVRVATKSVRCVSLLRRALDQPGYRGLLCYSAEEAVFLAARGFDDLLVGYPAWQEAQVEAVCRKVAEGRTIGLTVDGVPAARRLAQVAARCGVALPVCLDLDMSSRWPGLHFGVRRSPVRTPVAARELARIVADLPGLRLDGILGYEAQIAGLADATPGRRLEGLLVRRLKHRSARDVARRRREMVAAVREAAPDLRFVNGGGTGSLETTAGDAAVTEVSAGSGFFSPVLFDGYRAFRHLPAAGFALEITRRPGPGLFTCHGGGYVASGRAGREKLPSPYLPPGAELLDAEGAGEVQTPIRYQGPEPLDLGDPIFFRHAKAGELCEHFDRLVLVREGAVAGEAPTYRGEGECFL